MRRLGTDLRLLLLVVTVFVAQAATDRIRGQDGTLSLLVAVPLSKNNQTTLDPGWFHLAAAVLAVDHFNSRNNSIVKELGDLQDCGITFGDVVAVDTGTNSHQAMEYVLDQLVEMGNAGVVDAIAGPYNEVPALELSIMATGMKAPIVAHGAYDSNLLDPSRHPFYSQVCGDFNSEMQFIVNYLLHLERDNYIAILYSSTASEIQKVDILKSILEREGFDQVRTFGYKASGPEHAADGSVRYALEGIKATGYRTIVTLPAQLRLDLPFLGRAAIDLGMDQGGHFWILSGGDAAFTSREVYDFVARSHEMNATIMQGSAYVMAVDDTVTLNFPDNILQKQGRPFFDRVQMMSPVSIDIEDSGITNSILPIQKLVEISLSWMRGCSYMFDAVLAVGIGACQAIAKKDGNGTELTGRMHLAGIRSAVFRGTSGMIKFGGLPGSPGARAANTVPFTVINLLPYGPGNEPMFAETATLDPRTKQWIQRSPFTYADGTTTPPPLRDEPDKNYLSPKSRAAGLALMSVALVFIFVSALWVAINRNHSVVIAAQPALLYTLCLGSTMMALVILMQSYDESYGKDEEMLEQACIASVWLDSLGHMISFGALFTKLWRVNRCMRFKTSSVSPWRVIWPSVLLIGAMIILLSVYTATAEQAWQRKVIDETTGESIGRCVPESSMHLVAPIYILHFIPTILTGVMAWKTSGVDDLYSESKWVLAFILVQFQVMIVTVPVVVLINDLSTNGRFLCYSLLVWTFPMSTMGLIILPKIVTVRRMKRNATKTPRESETRPNPLPNSEIQSTNSASNASVTRSVADATLEQHHRTGPRIQIVTFD